MVNKKSAVKRMTVNLSKQEVEKLEKYCQQTGRPAIDVIRELILTRFAFVAQSA